MTTKRQIYDILQNINVSKNATYISSKLEYGTFSLNKVYKVGNFFFYLNIDGTS
jgi:hypothetical protein